MYKFWFDYVKRKYNEKAKLYYMDTDTDCTCKKIFMKINMKMLQKMFKKSVILQTMSQKNHCHKEKMKKL